MDYLAGIQKLRDDYKHLCDLESEQKQVASKQAHSQEVKLSLNYAKRLESMRDLFAKLQVVKPRPLTIPAIFHRTTDENFLSDYLAYILDPVRNGIGTIALSTFLHTAGFEIPEYEPDDVSIQREYRFSAGRLDLLIQIGDEWVFGVENKLYSPESNQQTLRYEKMLKNEFPSAECHFIFLTPSGYRPRSKAFHPLSYKKLLRTFNTISMPDDISPKSQVLWLDFLEHLNLYIVQERRTMQLSPRAKLYLENFDMINDLRKAFDRDWQELLENIRSSLLTHLGNPIWETNFNIKRYYWHHLYKRPWKENQAQGWLEFYFSPNTLQSRGFNLYLRTEGKKYKDFNELFYKDYLPGLQDQYTARDIIVYPKNSTEYNREHTLAWKGYKLDPSLDNIEEAFLDALKEFSFLIPVIDSIAEKLRT